MKSQSGGSSADAKGESSYDISEVKDFDLVLLANFVHQVVNPLNGIAGTLDSLADGTIKDEHRREQRLRASRAQIEQCIALVRNLAFLAQGFARLPEKDRKSIILPQMIIESAMFFQEDGRAKGIEIALQDRGTQNRVTGHPDLIRQVLMNIFDNCVKYSDANSVVEVNQRIQKKTGHAIITVKNKSKYSVDPVDVQKLFDLGYRGGNAKAVVASGTGLGMYICKKIVEDVHGGSIVAQSVGRTDLEFTIKLPGGEGG